MENGRARATTIAARAAMLSCFVDTFILHGQQAPSMHMIAAGAAPPRLMVTYSIEHVVIYCVLGKCLPLRLVVTLKPIDWLCTIPFVPFASRLMPLLFQAHAAQG